MTTELEPTEVVVEPTKPVSEGELGAEVSATEGEVSTIPPDAEAEITRRIQEAREGAQRESQSAKDKELKGLYEQLQTLQDQAREKDLALQEGREIESLGDTDEVKDFQKKRREVAARESKVSQGEQYWNLYYKRGEASLVAAEFGVEVKDLLEANSPDELRSKAETLRAEKRESTIKELQTQLEQAKKVPQKIDSSTPSAAGTGWRDMSPDEKIRQGLNKK